MNSLNMKCTQEILTIVSIMNSGVSSSHANPHHLIEEKPVFSAPHDQRIESEENRRAFLVEEGDHITYLNGS